jgi:hypothetical protein
MAELKCIAAPAQSAIKPGRSFALPEKKDILIGGAAHADVRLIDPSIAPEHARIVVSSGGEYGIMDLESPGGTYVEGRKLKPFDVTSLSDGKPLRLGAVEFLFRNVAACRSVATTLTLREWWERAQPAPAALTPDDLRPWLDICGTTALQQRQLPVADVLGWYRAYAASPRRCCLPIAVPYLIDIGTAIAFRQPPLRLAGRLKLLGDTQSLRYRHYLEYQYQHLCALAYHPAVRFIRERTAAVRNRPPTQGAIVVRFIWDVFKWVEEAWFRRDAGNDPARLQADADHCASQLRILTRPEDLYGFLIQLGNVMRAGRALQSPIDPLERFLLGARAQKESAFDTFDPPLITECLLSRGLDEEVFDPDPLDRQPRDPELPSRHPGEETTIRRVRVTNRIEKLPQVIPQELAVLKLQPDGKRHLISRLFLEGLKMWERQDYDSEVRRHRFLACFVADIGSLSETVSRGRGDGATFDQVVDVPDPSARTVRHHTSPSVHARRLVFEFLCDIAAFVDAPGLDMDIHVFQHPVGDNAKQRAHWALTLADLRTSLGKSIYDDMIELESRSPGYFFSDRQGAAAATADHAQWIHRAVESSDYDLMLFTFLAPSDNLTSLLPHDLPPPRKVSGVKVLVRSVQLGRWPNAVETAVARSFDDAALQSDFEYCLDNDLRYAVLEDLLGPCRRDSGGALAMAGEL